LTATEERTRINVIEPAIFVQTQGVVTVSQTAVSVFDLSPSEKLQLVEDLWDDLAAIPSDVPMPDWQVEELDRRKANLESNPASGLGWEEVKRRVRTRHGR
jgi:putative addiction module component (TIGR02574 family)